MELEEKLNNCTVDALNGYLIFVCEKSFCLIPLLDFIATVTVSLAMESNKGLRQNIILTDLHLPRNFSVQVLVLSCTVRTVHTT